MPLELIEKSRTAFNFEFAEVWQKCCGASGEADAAAIRVLKSPEGMESFFGKNWRDVRVLGVKLNPECSTSRVLYCRRTWNADTGEWDVGPTKSFQFGGALSRTVDCAPLASRPQVAVVDEMEQRFRRLVNGVVPEEQLKPFNAVAQNRIGRCNERTPPHRFHFDVKGRGKYHWAVVYPSPVKADKQHGGGHLVFAEPGMKFPSQAGDMNGVAGENMHGVGPVTETAESGPCPERHSTVLFTKPKKAGQPKLGPLVP